MKPQNALAMETPEIASLFGAGYEERAYLEQPRDLAAVRSAVICAITAAARAGDSVTELVITLCNSFDTPIEDAAAIEKIIADAARQVAVGSRVPRRVIARAQMRVRDAMLELAASRQVSAS